MGLAVIIDIYDSLIVVCSEYIIINSKINDAILPIKHTEFCIAHGTKLKSLDLYFLRARKSPIRSKQYHLAVKKYLLVAFPRNPILPVERRRHSSEELPAH